MRTIRRDLRDLLVGWSGFRCGGVLIARALVLSLFTSIRLFFFPPLPLNPTRLLCFVVVYFIPSVLVSRKGDEVDTMVISTREASLCHLDMVAPQGSEGMICVVLNM